MATAKYKNTSGSWVNWTPDMVGAAASSHTHDDRYYTESEMNTKLAAKSDTGHTHSYLPTAGGTMSGNITFASIGDTAKASGLSWSGSTDGASIYYQTRAADEGHLVLNMVDDANVTIDIAAAGTVKSYFSYDGVFNGTATYANNSGYATSAGSASTATALSSSAGSATQPVYFSNGKPVACTAYSSASVNYANSANYATSAGSASTATALSSSAGSSTQPVYFSNGKPVAATSYANANVGGTYYYTAIKANTTLSSSSNYTHLCTITPASGYRYLLTTTICFQNAGTNGCCLGIYDVGAVGYMVETMQQAYAGYACLTYSTMLTSVSGKALYLHARIGGSGGGLIKSATINAVRVYKV